MSYRIGKTSKSLREANQHKILKAIEENGNMTFKELLNEEIVSKEPLNRHLKNLLNNNDVEKYFSKTKNRIAYRLTVKGKIPITIESMIHYLGLVATHVVFAKKLKITPEFDINIEIKNYVRAKSKISPDKFYEYLQEQYPLTI